MLCFFIFNPSLSLFLHNEFWSPFSLTPTLAHPTAWLSTAVVTVKEERSKEKKICIRERIGKEKK
jgi:hypothetical protein